MSDFKRTLLNFFKMYKNELPRRAEITFLEEAYEHLNLADERIDKLEDALQKIKNWADAYPLDIFPEPDFKKAHKILTAEGMTLDAISASAMRHVITGVKEIVENALTGE